MCARHGTRTGEDRGALLAACRRSGLGHGESQRMQSNADRNGSLLDGCMLLRAAAESRFESGGFAASAILLRRTLIMTLRFLEKLGTPAGL